LSYQEDYPERIEIPAEDLSELQRIIITGFIKEGECKTRDALIAMLESDIAKYLDEVDYEPNMDWVDGVRYCIKMIREGNLDVD
jgi:hypothetical protein